MGCSGAVEMGSGADHECECFPPEKKPNTIWQLMSIAYNDKVLMLLTLAAIISLGLGIYDIFQKDVAIDWVEGVDIIVAILIVVPVGAANDYKKERKLSELTSTVSVGMDSVAESVPPEEKPKTIWQLMRTRFDDFFIYFIFLLILSLIIPFGLVVYHTSRLAIQIGVLVGGAAKGILGGGTLWWLKKSNKSLRKILGPEETADTKYQWHISGSLDGIQVRAFPDSGSNLDTLSAKFVKRHKLKMVKISTPPIELPNGGEIRVLGVVKVPFVFEGETSVYERTFTVLERCIHDVILGKPFLELTKSLSDNRHRMKRSICNLAPRICLMNPSKQHPYIPCSINGVAINASLDTGSDVMVISRRIARRIGLHVKMDEAHRTKVQLADGSLHYTDGMVVGTELRVGSSDSWGGRRCHICTSDFVLRVGSGDFWGGRRCNIHVWDALTCDFVLNNEFLFENQIFVKYKKYLEQQKKQEQHEYWDIWHLNPRARPRLHLIKLVKQRGLWESILQCLKGIFRRGAAQISPNPEPINPTTQRHLEEQRELCRQGDEADRIDKISTEEQREEAWKAENKRRSEWYQKNPPIVSQSSPP